MIRALRKLYGFFTEVLVPAGVDGSIFLAIVVTITLVAVFLLAHALAGHYDERVRRAERRMRGGEGLERGFGSIFGTVHAEDAREGEGEGEPLVRVTRIYTRRETTSPWELECEDVAGRVLRLVTDDGHAIEVDASEPAVEGFTEQDVEGVEVLSKQALVEIRPGDTVWVTGRLVVPTRERGAGAYRSSVVRPRLKAPKRGRVEISRDAPSLRWRARAEVHRSIGWTALVVLVGLHVVAWRQLDKEALSYGLGAPIHVTDGWEWIAVAAAIWIPVRWYRRARALR